MFQLHRSDSFFLFLNVFIVSSGSTLCVALWQVWTPHEKTEHAARCHSTPPPPPPLRVRPLHKQPQLIFSHVIPGVVFNRWAETPARCQFPLGENPWHSKSHTAKSKSEHGPDFVILQTITHPQNHTAISLFYSSNTVYLYIKLSQKWLDKSISPSVSSLFKIFAQHCLTTQHILTWILTWLWKSSFSHSAPAARSHIRGNPTTFLSLGQVETV